MSAFIGLSYISWNLTSIFTKILCFSLYVFHVFCYTYTAIINPGIPSKNKRLEYLNSELNDNYQIQVCNICRVTINSKEKITHCFDCNVCIESK